MTAYTPMYIFAMNIGDLLDQAMKQRGIRSQGALSRLSGVPQPTINRTLKNVSVPEFSTLKKLADALQLDVRALMDSEAQEASIAQTSPEAEQVAMVGKYMKRLGTLFAGRSEDEITRVVRAIEILMPPREAKTGEPPRPSRTMSFSDDDAAAGDISFSRRPRRKSGTHE